MPVRLTTATLAALALGFSGCSTIQRVDAPPLGAESPTRTTPAVPAPAGEPALPTLADGAAVPISVLLDLAVRESPNRQVFEANRAAAAAAISQARAWSNPELELSAGRAKAREADENGARPATMIGGIGLTQRVELPGKRAARVAAAEAERSIAERSSALDRLELEVEIRAAAVAVAGADARVAQALHGVELGTQVRTAVERRVQAGETDRGDLARAHVDLANAQLSAEAARAEAEAARAALRAWCGAALPAQFTVADALVEAPPAMALSEVQRRATATHPRLAVFDAQQAAGAAAIAAEERAWYPDLTLGVSANRETDTNDLGVSVGIDLPLWNRNDGGVAKARADLARLQAERRKELLALHRQIVTAWNGYERERRQIEGLQSAVLPAAREALKLKLAAFQAGDTALMEVIDARRMELGAETALTEARERAAQARIDLIRAVGADPLVPSTAPHATAPTTTSPIPAGVQP
ncbi:MAG: TolC family protein [Planctomycetes bacterium]|nr:TolC family protein [Planctomycetota bacterium]